MKTVERTQLLLRSVVVEQLIPEDHPARAIWELVGRLDLTPYTELVRSLEGAAGRPASDPQLLVSLWIYSYSRGISSAREIEAYDRTTLCSEFHYDPSTDTYVCPQGKRLRYDAKDPRAGTMRYRDKAAAADCNACLAKPFCCPRTPKGLAALAGLLLTRNTWQHEDARPGSAGPTSAHDPRPQAGSSTQDLETRHSAHPPPTCA